MAKLERLYTIPLGDAFKVSRSKRTPRAVKLIRAFITRHMKAGEGRVVISEALNKALWERSIQKPPRRVKVRLVKDDESIRAYLPDEKIAEPKKEAQKAAPAPKTEAPKAAPAAAQKPAAAKAPEPARAPEPAKAPAQKSDKK